MAEKQQQTFKRRNIKSLLHGQEPSRWPAQDDLPSIDPRHCDVYCPFSKCIFCIVNLTSFYTRHCEYGLVMVSNGG